LPPLSPSNNWLGGCNDAARKVDGSIPRTAIFDAFPQLWALAASGKLRIDIEEVPLADVESAWQRQDLHGRRIVIIP
jgi:hypothetical protein